MCGYTREFGEAYLLSGASNLNCQELHSSSFSQKAGNKVSHKTHLQNIQEA